MTADEPRLKALGEFIKSCRARLTPDRVGLPFGHTRRRLSGLRRDEVAELAGVSTTWYTWLEQGRDIQVSRHILDCIGRALRLNADEYMHLMKLAQFPIDTPADTGSLVITPGLRKIIDGIVYPSMVVNDRADVLAWNAASGSYFVDFSAVPNHERNMIWQWFTNVSLQARIANWEERSPYAVALFRGICDKYAGDHEITHLVEKLKQTSQYFAEQWARREVRQKSGGFLEFLFSYGEKQSFEVTSFLNINSRDDVHCYVFTPCE
ncbi:helix-turn-helix transcriptional regulator [Cohnella soli]|uniref:Helix-turn-helix transcriptional regulator n=1 Tax=Cohnella soli TaxID=425005 RepID=A0ABW0HN55_9BACL